MKRILLLACLMSAIGCSGKPAEVDQATVVPDPTVKPAPTPTPAAPAPGEPTPAPK